MLRELHIVTCAFRVQIAVYDDPWKCWSQVGMYLEVAHFIISVGVQRAMGDRGREMKYWAGWGGKVVEGVCSLLHS